MRGARRYRVADDAGAAVKIYADLHIHSKHSRACSRDCDLEHLAWWAARKGVSVVGTGDFTHPAWVEELRTKLVEAEPGLFRLRPDVERAVLERLPPACRTPVRFLLSSEISTIYKRDDRTRKVHHLLYSPGFSGVEEIIHKLSRIGNLGSDGRPILGLDSRDLLEITLESSGCYLVPAHVWTPWFAALGSQSGFDAIDDCYADLAGHIFAVETGLSSDPGMNWRVSSLDRYRLVSNSDAHSPPIVGREATELDTGLDYFSIERALRTGDGFSGTVELFPEEGKYHLDGHRACGVRTEPDETRDLAGRCPVCSKPLTVGVAHRIDDLADRPAGHRPAGADPFRSLVPLAEVLAEIAGVGPKSKTVRQQVDTLVGRLGPELAILGDHPLDEVAQAGSSLLVEAISRLRRGETRREAGYDGVYGTIRLFAPGELSTSTLFPAGAARPTPEAATPGEDASAGAAPSAPRRPEPRAATPGPFARNAALGTSPARPAASALGGLDDEQRAVVALPGGPLLVVAGPGAGKTRVLTRRLARRLAEGDAPAGGCLVVTFTRRASAEVRDRLGTMLGDGAGQVLVTTFHGLGLLIVREQHRALGLPPAVTVIDEPARLGILHELTAGSPAAARRLASLVAGRRRHDEAGPTPTAGEDPLDALAERYETELRRRGQVDLDQLVTLPLALLEEDPDLARRYQDRWPEVYVDEYQDIDGSQYRLLRLISRPDGNLCAIGDPDQAIYGFRGGDVGYFLRFGEDFPTARTVQLTRNHRSAPTIVRAALELIGPSTLVPGRILIPSRPEAIDAPVLAWQAESEEGEAEAVASSVERLLGGTSFFALDRGAADGSASHPLSFSDFAVLARTGAQLEPLAEALARRGFPVQRRTHERLVDRPEVRAVLAALAPPPGEGPAGPSVTARLEEATATTLDRLDGRRTPAIPDEPAAPAGGPLAVEAVAAVPELLGPLAAECGTDLDRFLCELALGVEVDTWDPRADRISLLTLHAAKGLEFPVVFVVGCEDGLLPLRRRPGDDTVDEAEERRLLFVGMTRATTRLVVTAARRRLRWGAVRQQAPSSFLASIDPARLAWRQDQTVGPARERAPYRQLRLL